MKYIKEGAIIFGITLIGELLNHSLPFPVPAGVYGLFLLLVLLCSGIIKLKDVEATGNFLLDIMPLLFIPASVGLMKSYREIQSFWFSLVVICAVSTIVVMIATGKIAEFLLRRKNDRSKGEQA